MFDEKLARALNFTEDDLTANRDGYMSKSQRVYLRQKITRERLWGALVASVIWVVIWFITWVALQKDGYVFLSIIVLPPIILMVYAYYSWRNLKADLAKGDVAMEMGNIVLHVEARLSHKLQVNHLYFPVDSQLLLALKDGNRYSVYYTPHSKYLLSAEPIREDE